MSDNYTPKDDNQILIPEISEDDVLQEQALLILESKGRVIPRKDFIRKRLQTVMGPEGLYRGIPRNASNILGSETQTDPEVIRKLLEWAIEQGEEAEEIVTEFLQNPSESNLKICIKKLVNRDLIPEYDFKKDIPDETPSLASLLARQLKKLREMSMEDLYKLAEDEHPSRRPRAAVRQTIRRWQEKGFVAKLDDIVYWNPNTHDELKANGTHE